MTIDIHVAFDSLTSDAVFWDEIADGIGEIKGHVDSLDLAPSVFTVHGAAVNTAYAALQVALSSLLDDGEAQTRAAATALREIRTEFEELELNIASDVESMWQPAD